MSPAARSSAAWSRRQRSPRSRASTCSISTAGSRRTHPRLRRHAERLPSPTTGSSATIGRKLRFSLWMATIDLHGRPALVVAAVLSTLLALALFVSVLRSGRTRAPRRPPHGADRRRVRRAKRDPREALQLVGNALAATHDARALTPLILEVVTEATGARGGELIQGGEVIGWFGDVERGAPLEFVLTNGEDAVDRTTLLLYQPRGGFQKETRTLAEWLSSQAGIAPENARLHERGQRQAPTPPPTRPPHRRPV